MENQNIYYEQVLQRICDLLKEQKTQQKDLCEALNLKNKSFTEWKAGRSTSYMKKLPEIADYFGVSVNYLLGYEEIKKAPEEDDLSEGEKLLLDLFRQIPPDKQELALQMLKAALGK